MEWQTGQPTEEKDYIITTEDGEIKIASWTNDAYDTLWKADNQERWLYTGKYYKVFYNLNDDHFCEVKAKAWAELPEPYKEDAA